MDNEQVVVMVIGNRHGTTVNTFISRKRVQQFEKGAEGGKIRKKHTKRPKVQPTTDRYKRRGREKNPKNQKKKRQHPSKSNNLTHYIQPPTSHLV